MNAAGSERGVLLGSAARPVLITVIEWLRPDLDPVAVGGAVERIVLCSEEAHDIGLLWEEVRAALAELIECDTASY